MQLRILLMLMLTLACGMIGRSIAAGSARRVKILGEIMDAIQLLRVHMLVRRMSVQAALSASQLELFRYIGGEINMSEGPWQVWQKRRGALMAHGNMLDCLTNADCCVLDALFVQLGGTTVQEQDALFSAAMRSLGAQEEEARRKSADTLRLYTTLGVIGGCALAVCLI